jgi:FkbM family methyltransferase
MRGLSALQKTLQLLPIRGKGRLADIIFQALKPEEIECHPLREVTVFLRPSQRIERLMWGGAYERDLVALFKRALKPGMTVLDVGANIGYFSAIASGLVGSEGSVHAFEPVPESFTRLQRNLSDFRWSHAYPCAVGDITRLAKIYFNERELGWGSLLSDNNLTRATDAQVISLDNWMIQEGLRTLNLIKIDVEGGEYRVLQGAERMLRDFRPIVTAELNSVCLSRDHHTPEDVVQLLKTVEYRTFSFNGGVLAIPMEAGRLLSDLRAYMKNPFR